MEKSKGCDVYARSLESVTMKAYSVKDNAERAILYCNFKV